MNDQEWMDMRKSGIGGSDASAILGLSPWKSPMDIWLDKKEFLSLKMPRGVDPYYKSVIKFLTQG